MTTTVRLPHRVEQALASYCVENRRTKSEVIVELLEQRLLGTAATEASPYALAEAAGFIACVEGETNSAANAKKLVREKIRAKHSR
jgi:predicted DNA-binding protein